MMYTLLHCLLSCTLCCLCFGLNSATPHSSKYFSGTTGIPQFPCHCVDPDEQCSDVSGACVQSGCDDETLPWAPWSGPGCQIGNVALGKYATKGGYWGYPGRWFFKPANNSVDGHKGIDKVLIDNYQVLKVDLGSTYVVDKIIVFLHYISRIEMYIDNPLNVRLSMGDIDNTSITENTYNHSEQCRHAWHAEAAQTFEWHCNIGEVYHRSRVGQYVHVESESIMWIKEVYVNGYVYHKCQGLHNGDYFYGPGCLLSCHCDSQCDQISGLCPGSCRAGYSGDRCQPCDEEHWGPDCSSECHCSVACDSLTGYCSDTCDDGYTGYNCQQCDDDHWGPDCSSECHCSVPCRDSDGWCDGLCEAGYKGNNCQSPCNMEIDGWGPSCLITCGCSQKQDCHPVTGICINGTCHTDWHSPHTKYICMQCGPRRWGPQCSNMCDFVCAYNDCDPVTGACLRGCVAGIQGELCNQLCDEGHYGPKCGYQCDCDKGCNPLGGCENYCPHGYHGTKCQHECNDGHYGEACMFACNCMDETEICNKTTGACQSGCPRGFTDSNCDIHVSDFRDVTKLIVLQQATTAEKLTIAVHTPIHVYKYLLQYRLPGNSSWVSLQNVSVYLLNNYLLSRVFLSNSLALMTITLSNASYAYYFQAVPYWFPYMGSSVPSQELLVTCTGTCPNHCSYCQSSTNGADCMTVNYSCSENEESTNISQAFLNMKSVYIAVSSITLVLLICVSLLVVVFYKRNQKKKELSASAGTIENPSYLCD